MERERERQVSADTEEEKTDEERKTQSGQATLS